MAKQAHDPTWAPQFKVRERILGIHHQLMVFVRDHPTETWANAGSLMMSPRQAQSLRDSTDGAFEDWELPE
jgi:hypothetical protein